MCWSLTSCICTRRSRRCQRDTCWPACKLTSQNMHGIVALHHVAWGRDRHRTITSPRVLATREPRSIARCRAEKPAPYVMSAPTPSSKALPEFSQSQLRFSVVCALATVGLFHVASMAASGLTFAWRQYVRPPKPLLKYGKWAVVTGASSGIGRAYCDYLANQGDCRTACVLRRARPGSMTCTGHFRWINLSSQQGSL